MLFEEREKHLWRGLHHVYVQERKQGQVEGDFKNIRYR